MNSLILAVRVAPQAEQWFEKLVAEVLRKYGCTGTVERSDLDKKPLF
jgi:hypothetical protein